MKRGGEGYALVAVTTAKQMTERLAKDGAGKVHAELATKLQKRLDWRSPAPAPRAESVGTGTPVANGPRQFLQRAAEPNHTPRVMLLDRAGEVAMPATPAPGLMGPTVVTLQLPLTPQQAMIVVAAEHAPALLAIDTAMTLSVQHLRGRGLATFTNVKRLTDVINGLRDPERGDLARWDPAADCLLLKAVHDQQIDGGQVNWLAVAEAVGRDASECAPRWTIVGWVSVSRGADTRTPSTMWRRLPAPGSVRTLDLGGRRRRMSDCEG
jgi:hypothetical protein